MIRNKKKWIALLLASLLVLAPAVPAYGVATAAPAANTITVTNNAGLPDTLRITGRTPGDMIKVYGDLALTTLKVSGAVAALATETTLTYPQLDPSDNGETVYVTVTSLGSTESTATPIVIPAVAQSPDLVQSQVTVLNNFGMADSVEIKNVDGTTPLVNGDLIKIYSTSGGNPAGVGYYSDKDAKATILLAPTFLLATGGTINVTLTKTGKLESGDTAIPYSEEGTSGTLIEAQVKITNNAVIADTIVVTGLAADDTVKAYKDMASTSALSSGKAVKQADNSYTASFAVVISTSDAGTMALTLTSKGKKEGDKVEFSYAAAPKTDKLDPAYISIENLSIVKDTITVSAIGAGDIVKVYKADGTTLFASAAVLTGKTSVNIAVPQIGETAGILYISLTKLGYKESDLTEKTYPAEAVSDVLVTDNIVVTNNFEIPDTVKVTGLTTGDIIKVYRTLESETPLSSAVVPPLKTETQVSIGQLGVDTGSVFVAVTRLGKLESPKLEKAYAAESSSLPPLVDGDADKKVTITNFTGKPDTIFVEGLLPLDKVYVYKDDVILTALASGIVPTGKDNLTISAAQLGADGGFVHLSVKSGGKMESDRVSVSFLPEPTTDVTGITVTVTNLADLPDTIKLEGANLSLGQTIKLYKTEDGVIPFSIAQVSKLPMTLSAKQLGVEDGTLWLTITTTGKRESVRISTDYDAEVISAALVPEDITIVNHTGRPDTIKITGASGATVKIFKPGATDPALRTLIATGIIPTGGSITLNYYNLGDTSGKIYLTQAKRGERSSLETEVTYEAAGNSTAPLPGPDPVSNVIVTNNSGKPDTVKVTGLTGGDVMRIYTTNDSKAYPISQLTVPTGVTYISAMLPQIGADGGTLYVSVQSIDKLESTRTPITFPAENPSTPIHRSQVIIINNVGSDFILVGGLSSGDIVRVYTSTEKPALITMGTVQKDVSYIYFSIKQLGATAGSINFSVTNLNCRESAKTEILYPGEDYIPLFGNPGQLIQ